MLTRAAQQGTVYRGEILVDFFGWPIQGSPLSWNLGQHFRPEVIGEKKYFSNQASLTRAWRRLVNRGLIRTARVLALTDRGQEMVRSWGIEPVPTPEWLNRSLEDMKAEIQAIIG
jgi:hypothetical protein